MLCWAVGGCRVKIHFSFFALVAFCNLFAGLANGGILLFSVFMHEFAHLAVMVARGCPPAEVLISGLGMRLRLPEGRSLPYRCAVWVSLAGPFMNLLLFAGCFLLGLRNLALVNLSLGLFHLLPVVPLDGGLALKAALSVRIHPGKAEKISFILSFLILLPLMVVGFMLLLHTKNNFTLLALSIYLMLYLVLSNGKLDL